MKKTILLLSIIFLSVCSYSQPEHMKNFLRCGFPRLSDYHCYNYDTINAPNPHALTKSSDYNQSQIPFRLERKMRIMRTAAYLVIKDDKIIYENYWVHKDRDSILNSFSVAKSIVSLLVGIAIDQGKIKNINQKVVTILPWFNQGMDTTLRIIDLLTMSSGLNWNEDFANPMSDVAKAYYGDYLDSLIREVHVVKTPGKTWKYQCGNTVILALILEKVTGEPIYKYAEQKLWIPIGATHTAYWGKSSRNGLTKAFCCFYATPRDFAKLGLLVLHKGFYNGKQIVSKRYINEVITPANWLKYKNKKVNFYGLHFWLVKHHGEYLPYFSGMFGQYIIIFPRENAVVVRFGEMINQLGVESVPPDLKLYLKAADKLLK